MITAFEMTQESFLVFVNFETYCEIILLKFNFRAMGKLNNLH